jgi:hypothetical protein
MKTKQVELRKIQLQHDEARDMLTTRAEERRVHKVATTTVNDLSFMSPPGSGVKRSADAAPQVGRMKLQRLRANSLDANAIREMFVTSLTDALSPGEIDTDERNELLDKQEDLGLDDDEFFRIIGGLGWSRRDFMRGKKNSGKKLAVKSRVELVKSASSTPTTRAGVDDDGSDSD